MPTSRTARTLARLVLAWFVFYVGAAIASPLLMPGRYDVICSADGIARLAHGDGGGTGEAAASLHCPLCMPTGTPPPPAPVVAVRPAEPLAYALRAEPRAGWTLVVAPGSVSWRADSPQTALAGAEHAEFVVRGTLTATPGTLWFKVLQSRDVGSTDWAQVPTSAADKPAFPAARLEVLAPGVAAVDVRDAWVRIAVRGQSGTGAFMTLAAPAGARLVGASTPVAGNAEVHEMKMEGDVMRMRAVAAGLELPPRQAVELKPGGYHVMLTELKRPLVAGETVPLALEFVDREGRKGVARLQLPVRAAPAGSDDAASAAHRH